jgi:hypothetical protein
VALADHDAVLREGSARLLEHAGLDVVGQCGDVSELIRQVPGVAGVDIEQGLFGGVSAITPGGTSQDASVRSANWPAPPSLLTSRSRGGRHRFSPQADRPTQQHRPTSTVHCTALLRWL